jgi:hypothetical protein
MSLTRPWPASHPALWLWALAKRKGPVRLGPFFAYTARLDERLSDVFIQVTGRHPRNDVARVRLPNVSGSPITMPWPIWPRRCADRGVEVGRLFWADLGKVGISVIEFKLDAVCAVFQLHHFHFGCVCRPLSKTMGDGARAMAHGLFDDWCRSRDSNPGPPHYECGALAS